MTKDIIDVIEYKFSSDNLKELNSNHYAKNLWPLVYILNDGKIKVAYVGETTNLYDRATAHLKHEEKSKLSSIILITCDKFNKSATLDIESNLIRYLSGDAQYRLLNANLGIANHNYYQKQDVYWNIFCDIWEKLLAKGITKHTLSHISNSDLFKYSPYQSLSKEQIKGLITILECILDEKTENTIIEGGAGTGKTVLATFAIKLLMTDTEEFNFREFDEKEKQIIELTKNIRKKFPNPKVCIVVPMQSFRTTLQRAFKYVNGLNREMVVGPTNLAENEYDIVLVDESHRLRRIEGIGPYIGHFNKASKALGFDKDKNSELDWVLKKSKKAIFFYDRRQSIKPADVLPSDFEKLRNDKKTRIEKLKSQFRTKGGNAYIDFVEGLLHCKFEKTQKKYHSKKYECILFESLQDMIDTIKKREKEGGLARLIAGFSWKWASKDNQEQYDISIESINLTWNRKHVDWVNSKNAINEVGCIHTTQGYDLNYAGIIFGKEISYDPDSKKIIVFKEHYHDTLGKYKVKDPEELKAYILNIYQTILLRGIKGTYIYAYHKNLRDYLSQYLLKHSDSQITSKINFVPQHQLQPFKNAIPLYSLQVAAGEFGNQQDVEQYNWIKPPPHVKPSEDSFACEVIGESMNKVIPNGSICLFRRYKGGSRGGKIVLAECTDFNDPDSGSCYTVKMYASQKTSDNESWRHKSIELNPLSTNSNYRKLVLEEDESKQFRVIGIFECVLGFIES